MVVVEPPELGAPPPVSWLASERLPERETDSGASERPPAGTSVAAAPSVWVPDGGAVVVGAASGRAGVRRTSACGGAVVRSGETDGVPAASSVVPAVPPMPCRSGAVEAWVRSVPPRSVEARVMPPPTSATAVATRARRCVFFQRANCRRRAARPVPAPAGGAARGVSAAGPPVSSCRAVASCRAGAANTAVSARRAGRTGRMPSAGVAVVSAGRGAPPNCGVPADRPAPSGRGTSPGRPAPAGRGASCDRPVPTGRGACPGRPAPAGHVVWADRGMSRGPVTPVVRAEPA